MAADALIFDLDGTVWDSASWFATALARGDPAAADTHRTQLIDGGNIIKALDHAGMSRNRLLSEALCSGPPPLFPAMREALNELAARGLAIGVATSLPGTLALPMLAAADLADVFGIVVHAGTCRTPKPHPRSILMALDLLNIPASPTCFYVGDRASDADAAARAGVSFAWMSHGYERPAADTQIRPVSPEELLEL